MQRNSLLTSDLSNINSLTTWPAKILPISRITKVIGRIKNLRTSNIATKKEKAEDKFRVQNIIKNKEENISEKNKTQIKNLLKEMVISKKIKYEKKKNLLLWPIKLENINTIIWKIEYSQSEFKFKKGKNVEEKPTKNVKKSRKIIKFTVSPIKETSVPQRGIIKRLYERRKNSKLIKICRTKLLL